MTPTMQTQYNTTAADMTTDNTKTIPVNIEPQYGKWVYYPVCKHAHTFAAIAGTKTLTDATLKHILSLGYEIKSQATSAERLINSMVR